MPSPSQLTPRERRALSRLRLLLRASEGIAHGSLVRMERRCGRENCRCARGELHASWYLSVWENGRTRMVYIPKAWEERVRAWGQVDLQDAAVDLGPERSPLVRLRGTVAFEGRRLYADPLTAQFRGRPVRGSVHTDPDGPWRFEAETRVPGRGLSLSGSVRLPDDGPP